MVPQNSISCTAKSMLPAATSCSSGFQRWVRDLSMSADWARCHALATPRRGFARSLFAGRSAHQALAPGNRGSERQPCKQANCRRVSSAAKSPTQALTPTSLLGPASRLAPNPLLSSWRPGQPTAHPVLRRSDTSYDGAVRTSARELRCTRGALANEQIAGDPRIAQVHITQGELPTRPARSGVAYFGPIEPHSRRRAGPGHRPYKRPCGGLWKVAHRLKGHCLRCSPGFLGNSECRNLGRYWREGCGFKSRRRFTAS
jgi:hypothetical protein